MSIFATLAKAELNIEKYKRIKPDDKYETLQNV
jgi:hypothetical protein